MKAPFPYFGGKSRIAELVWERFGDDITNYIEPFGGSLAVLLGRPIRFKGVETVNDKNAYIANFWRAMQYAPEAVCEHSSWPVNETDMHAAHKWLMSDPDVQVSLERVKRDRWFFDARVAACWVWGMCCWIGGGWCHETSHHGQHASAVARSELATGRRPAIGQDGHGLRVLP